MNISKEAMINVAKPFLVNTWKKHTFSRQKFRISLEGPLHNDCILDTVYIKGWAVPLTEEPVKASIWVNGKYFKDLPFDVKRADVQEIFSFLPTDSCFGFNEKIAWASLAGNAATISLELRFTCAGEELHLGPYTLCHVSSFGFERPTLHAVLERPRHSEMASEQIQISGWAASLDACPPVIRAIINDNQIVDIPLNQPREDVRNLLHIDSAPQDNFGFEVKIPWSSIGKLDSAEVRLEIKHGRDCLSIGPITVGRTERPFLRHQRGSYKESWDGWSQDVDNAKRAVAGYVDEDEFKMTGQSTADTLREALQINSQDIVLEIGCGVGRIGEFLAPICKKWIGTDISAEMVRHTKERLAKFSNIEAYELEGCDLRAFADQSLDKIYCSTVFMHLDEWDRYRYVREAYRTLRPAGMLYVDNLNLAGEIGWQTFMEALELDPASRPAAISKPSTAQELSEYLQRAGFKDIEVRPGGHYVAAFGKKI
jgi:ubiquinone/menaquinone biosynthesis C-methylase UbiE